MLAFAGKAHQAASFAFLIVVALPLLLHTILREHSRMRMGNYVRAVLEPQLMGMTWEAYVSSWRRRRGESGGWLGRTDRLKHIAALSGLYVVVSQFCWILLLTESGAVPPKIVGSAGIVLLVLMIVYFYRLYAEGAKEFDDLNNEVSLLQGQDFRQHLEEGLREG